MRTKDKKIPKEKLICARYKLPIPKGMLYMERKDKKPVHWRCGMGALDDAIDHGPGIGTPGD